MAAKNTQASIHNYIYIYIYTYKYKHLSIYCRLGHLNKIELIFYFLNFWCILAPHSAFIYLFFSDLFLSRNTPLFLISYRILLKTKVCNTLQFLVKIQSTQTENLRLQHTSIPSNLSYEQVRLASSKERSYQNSMASLYIHTQHLPNHHL